MFRRYLRDADRDCAQYEILFEKENKSLLEVLDEISHMEEWGDIRVFIRGKLAMKTSYLNDRIDYGPNDHEFLHHCGIMSVKKATAIGGWGAMDYKLYI